MNPMLGTKIALNFITLFVCFHTVVATILYTQMPYIRREGYRSLLITSLAVSAALLTALAYFPTQ